ncbi:MAG: hypothetical protein MZV65_28520 [Chromatiales bacterium]|nr:hypothetical protein [Chromatiales bacterium]
MMNLNDLLQAMNQILSGPFSGDANWQMMGLYRQAEAEIERHLTALVDDHNRACFVRQNERVHQRNDREWNDLLAIRERWTNWHPATPKAA